MKRIIAGGSSRMWLAFLVASFSASPAYCQMPDSFLPLLPELRTEAPRKPNARPVAVTKSPRFHVQDVQGQEKRITVRENLPELIDAYLLRGGLLSLEPTKEGKSTKYKDTKDLLLQEFRRSIADARKRASRDKSYAELYAVTTLITELADKEYDPVGSKMINNEDEKLTRSLADDLLPLADPSQEEDWHIRYVALRTLGKITPEPDKTIAAVRENLKRVRDPASLRQAAAYALVDLARNADLLLLSKSSNLLAPIKTYTLVAETARIGLRDADATVRGYCVLALVESAASFKAQVLPPPFDPNKESMQRPLVKDVNKNIFRFDLKDPEFKGQFYAAFKQYHLANAGLLASLRDPSAGGTPSPLDEKIQLTSLDAIESILMVRELFVDYWRRETNTLKDSARDVFRKLELADPLEEIINDRGQTILRLGSREQPQLLRRKAMVILEEMGTELSLLEKGSVLEPLTEILRNPTEDIFVRWSIVNAVENLIRGEPDLDKDRLLLAKMFGLKMPCILRSVVTDADPELSKNLLLTRRFHPLVGLAYPDPNLLKRAISALDSLGDVTNRAGTTEEKKQIGIEMLVLLDTVFLLRERTNYDFAYRFDVETRNGVLRTLSSLAGEYLVEGIGTIALAVDERNEIDPRVRRAAAESLGKIASSADRVTPELENTLKTVAVPALQRALQRDDDALVRLSASASIVVITGLKQAR